MRKFVAGVLAGISVVLLSLISLLLDPSVFLQWHWKLVSAGLAAVAIVCLFLQAVWIKEDEEEERRERRRLTDLLEKLLKNQERLDRKQGHKKRMVAERAADCAIGLLRTLAETGPNVRTFHPIDHGLLFRQLRTAFHTGREAFEQGEHPVSRKKVFAEVARLVDLTISADLEE